MRLKGKLIKWDADKAYGFIAPNGGGDHVFIHKRGFANKNRTPQLNDVITFTLSKDNHGRHCADEATFSGEKLKKKQAKKVSKFSIYLSLLFLIALGAGALLGFVPVNLVLIYIGLSIVTYIAYAFDKARAQSCSWRIPEDALHMLALFGGWPGAAVAQQVLRHKSQKKAFRIGFWFTVAVNVGLLYWLLSASGNPILAALQ
ncbi:DUF1294 domain-containing protein [Thalassotalea sp. LPB0316]|uniref:DUF1294 domain-containing protein n=1 Tax=Thalassotalea sp. LPB0316 TaxID=2769490 RepID=UPI001865DFCF|nr:DUF1294 domain-containing protein [Thalassotalea sp. LPB0316]QOL26240.1 DUF1294 domain-containing protein [Thalassotalea sp. LPB0316]